MTLFSGVTLRVPLNNGIMAPAGHTTYGYSVRRGGKGFGGGIPGHKSDAAPHPHTTSTPKKKAGWRKGKAGAGTRQSGYFLRCDGILVAFLAVWLPRRSHAAVAPLTHLQGPKVQRVHYDKDQAGNHPADCSGTSLR